MIHLPAHQHWRAARMAVLCLLLSGCIERYSALAQCQKHMPPWDTAECSHLKGGEGHMSAPPPERLLTIREVMARTSLSRSYIYALMRKGAFPDQRKLGHKCARWRESEVDAWARGSVT
jgi:prophage regulatory protein